MVHQLGGSLTTIISFVQQLLAKDKTAIVSAVMLAIVSLVSGLGLHLSGSAVGIISALVSAGLGYFVHVHFAAKLGEHAKP